jgi:hypothetical protein
VTRNDRILEKAIEIYECLTVLLTYCRFVVDEIEPEHIETLLHAYDLRAYVERG